MISYTTVGTNDFDKAKAFYDALFAQMDIGELWSGDGQAGYGRSMDTPMFMVMKPHDGEVATAGNGTMIALSCRNKDDVHKLHEMAIKMGGSDEGAPGPRGSSGFYCGYFRDLDGNKINAFAMVKPEA